MALQETAQLNRRLDVADVLRGVAVMGIVLLHSIEHFNFYRFPEDTPFPWMNFTDKIIWDGLFFLFAGKAYAIFSLLFGFSFYIQNHNQHIRGKDFRLRFVWRLILLFMLAQLNAAFFTAEILTLYAMMGFVLVLCAKIPTRALIGIIVVLLLQPVEWGKLIYALLNPEYTAGASLDSAFWPILYKAQSQASFGEMLKVNLWEGQLASLTWAWENGRVFQTAALFLLGLCMGRLKLLLFTPTNERVWFKMLGIALVLFFPLSGLNQLLPDFIEREEILKPLQLILKSITNLSFMVLLVSAVWFLFHYSHKHDFWMRFAAFGRMSLTNYLTQSLIGSFFFYHWGLDLQIGVTYSALFGVVLFFLQFVFCNIWLKHFNQGPFEWLWKKLTWII